MVYQKTIAAAMLAAGAMAEPHLGLGLDLSIGGSSQPAASSSGDSCEGPKNPGGCREQCFLKALADVCVLDTPECRCANAVVLKAAVDACVDLVPLNVCLDIDLTLFGSSFDASCANLDQNCANAKGRLGPNAKGTPAQTPSVAVGTPLVNTPAASATPMTTSVVYETQLHTVTKCASTVTDCPAHEKTPEVVTSIVPKYTTVCPVSEAQKTPEPSVAVGTPLAFSSSAAPSVAVGTPVYQTPSPSVAVGTPLYFTPSPSAGSSDVQGLTSSAPMTTSVVYETQLHTVTKCASTVTDCPAHEKTPEVVTSVVPKYTTVCPVSEAEKTPEPSVAVGTPEVRTSSVLGMTSAPAPSAPAASGPAPSAPAASGPAPSGPAPSGPASAPVASGPAPSAPAPQGPSTVYQTQVSTIYDCPPEVTNCPSHEKTPKAVTSVVPMTSNVPATSVDVPAETPATSPAVGSPSAPAPEVPATSDVVGLSSAPAPSAPAASGPAPSAPAASGPAPSAPAASAPAPSAPAASGPAPSGPASAPVASGPAPSAPAPQGPSTVYQTQVSTILDCPPEVTNCPSHEKTPTAKTSIVQSTGPAVPDVPASSVLGHTSGPAPSAPAPSGPASAPVASGPAPSAPAPSAPAASGPAPSGPAPSGPASAPVASGPAPSAPASGPAPSAPAEGPSTVFTTQVSTILDCPPEVTNCPEHSKTPSTVYGTTMMTGSVTVGKPQPTPEVPAVGTSPAPACSGAGCSAPAPSAPAGTPSAPAGCSGAGCSAPAPSAPAVGTASAPGCSGAGCSAPAPSAPAVGTPSAPAGCSGAGCSAPAPSAPAGTTASVEQPKPTPEVPAVGTSPAPACSGAGCVVSTGSAPAPSSFQTSASVPAVSSVVGLTSGPAPSCPGGENCPPATSAPATTAPAASCPGGENCPAPSAPATSAPAVGCNGKDCPVPCSGADCVISSASSATPTSDSFTFAYSSGVASTTPAFSPTGTTPSPSAWTGAASKDGIAKGVVAFAAAAAFFF